MSAYATTLPSTDAAGLLLRPHGGLTRDDVMTAPEAAELLKLPVSTVYELARRGELPASRLGRTWRFLRPRLEELLAS
jgi:excisionase family DNA binding protein